MKIRNTRIKIAMLVLGLVALAFGCQDQQIAKLSEQLNRQRLEYEDKLKKHLQKLLECNRQNEQLQQQLQHDLHSRVDDVAETIVEQNTKLRQELEELKAQVAQLHEIVNSNEETSSVPQR